MRRCVSAVLPFIHDSQTSRFLYCRIRFCKLIISYVFYIVNHFFALFSSKFPFFTKLKKVLSKNKKLCRPSAARPIETINRRARARKTLTPSATGKTLRESPNTTSPLSHRAKNRLKPLSRTRQTAERMRQAKPTTAAPQTRCRPFSAWNFTDGKTQSP